MLIGILVLCCRARIMDNSSRWVILVPALSSLSINVTYVHNCSDIIDCTTLLFKYGKSLQNLPSILSKGLRGMSHEERICSLKICYLEGSRIRGDLILVVLDFKDYFNLSISRELHWHLFNFLHYQIWTNFGYVLYWLSKIQSQSLGSLNNLIPSGHLHSFTFYKLFKSFFFKIVFTWICSAT